MALSLVDVENLSNYTEDTFTPVLSDASSGGNLSSTSANQSNYTKIGRVVFFNIRFSNIDTTGMTAGNQLYVQGLPFTSVASESIPCSVWMQSVTGLETDILSISARIVTGTASLRFEEMRKSGTDSSFNVNDVSSGATDIEVAGFYFV
tara:strand:- start:33 stop:479 length:447 start_codon:yes stop_codon:yes gene_type:complete